LINLIQFDLKEEKQRNKEKLLYVDIENFIKCFISNLKILIERPMLYKCLYTSEEKTRMILKFIEITLLLTVILIDGF
jgi:hypothetical protein